MASDKPTEEAPGVDEPRDVEIGVEDLSLDPGTGATASAPAQTEDFDIVAFYNELLVSNPDMTMAVAALEALIEVLRTIPLETSMETVEVVRKQKQALVTSTLNPLPVLAGADIFEQYLLRSLRGQPAADTDRVMSFEQTRSHLVLNRQEFAINARKARDGIATHGCKYIKSGRVVLAAGGSRAVTQILLRAASFHDRHFKVIWVDDESPNAYKSLKSLFDVGLEVEVINPRKVAYVLGNCKDINVVLVGAEAILQNGGIISRMGTSQIAHLTRTVKGSMKRFLVAAETHKIVRKTPLSHPIINRLGIRQKDFSGFDKVGVEVEEALLRQDDEVDYTDPDLIDGIITELGMKTTSQIWEMVDDYI
ncbi:hypothetical protein QBC47DRAFT_420305 [Echria macrotheca]|uniref:Translation initiation factor eIF2B subunit alpha n=1 Tax=Echria macrotheca TaxID=438768 RepID=A0AAJ0BJG5_9PEZI|nr:hypothetical protein QBC47DRAFT_420305 [Echria macrotheca]